MPRGIVVRIESKDYYVELDDGNILRAALRGKLKNKYHLKKGKLFNLDIATVGDSVDLKIDEDNLAVIEKVHDRKNFLSRKAPKIKGANSRGERFEQIIAANIDNVCIVASITNPMFKNGLVDRIIVASESNKINPVIIINKIDLDEIGEASYWKDLYEDIGYDVFLTSAKENIGIKNLFEKLQGQVSVFWGQSGVGKSSLLNSIFPGLNFKTGEVSYQTNKGRHTTVTSILKNMVGNTSIIDTPGIREIDPFGIEKEDLGHYFREFEKHIHDCKFNTCTHHHEPGCAVLEALDREDINLYRYQSYMSMLESIEESKVY